MAQLSSMPSVGPTLPSGCTNVKVTTTAADPSGGSNKIDITTLSDTERVYQDAPLVDAGAGAENGITQTVTCSFFGEAPEPSAPGSTGWVCTNVETEYAVGDMIKGTATYVYKEPPAE